ncbi:MAG: DNA polymerase III subunit beta [Myxococcales bacterium]|nr:DNA polymerase III subunit beta [Polyangiaceae bacterium]MDW8248175.1 DNA polymerase III subunit beta [Myxococcales bacterium]
MDLTVSKKDLLRMAKRAQAVADKKSTMPMLSNVLLDGTTSGELKVQATDLYLSVSGRITAEVRKRGAIALQAKDLFDRVNIMPEGPVHISTLDNGTTTRIRTGVGKLEFRLSGVPGGDFPTLPVPPENAQRYKLPAELVKRLINHTKFSISPDDTRPNLNSALFEWYENRLKMVTTDGHRLSKMEVVLGENQGAASSLLLPLKAIGELERLAEEALAEAKGEKDSPPPYIVLIPSEGSAFFDVAGVLFSVKLVDAQFPSYKKVIPEHSSRTARIATSGFAERLRAVSLAANDRTGGIKLTLAPGILRISSESPDRGEASDELPMDYQGNEIVIGFNAKYFQDVLTAIKEDSDDVLLGLSGELDPAVLRPAYSSEEDAARFDFVAVVMPMRI